MMVKTQSLIISKQSEDIAQLKELVGITTIERDSEY